METMMTFPRLFRAALLGAFALAFSAISATAASNSPWDALVAELKAKYPDLEAQRHLIKSIAATADAKMAWDDPMIELGVMSLPVNGFRFDKEDMTQKTIGITQTIPSPGKRSAMKNMVLSDVAMVKAETAMMTAELVAELKKSVFELAYIEKALKILEETESLLDEFVKVSNVKYSTGKGIQANVIQAQVERTKLADRKLALDEKKGRAAAMINRLLGRDERESFSIDPALLDTPDEIGFDGIWSQASANSPSLKVAMAQEARAKRTLEKEEAESGFDFSLMAEYGLRDDSPMERPDLFSAKVGVSVPLWKSFKQDRYVAGARFGVEEAASRRLSTEKKLRVEIQKAVVSMNRERGTIKLYRNAILPQAALAFESSLAAYQLDKSDFLTVLMNEQTLLQYELEAEEALMRLRFVHADVEAMTGALTGGENE